MVALLSSAEVNIRFLRQRFPAFDGMVVRNAARAALALAVVEPAPPEPPLSVRSHYTCSYDEVPVEVDDMARQRWLVDLPLWAFDNWERLSAVYADIEARPSAGATSFLPVIQTAPAPLAMSRDDADLSIAMVESVACTGSVSRHSVVRVMRM